LIPTTSVWHVYIACSCQWRLHGFAVDAPATASSKGGQALPPRPDACGFVPYHWPCVSMRELQPGKCPKSTGFLVCINSRGCKVSKISLYLNYHWPCLSTYELQPGKRSINRKRPIITFHDML
jgi:hypothetical protein